MIYGFVGWKVMPDKGVHGRTRVGTQPARGGR
jgi:hypothetical protein